MINSILLMQQNPVYCWPSHYFPMKVAQMLSFCLSVFGKIYTCTFFIHIVTAKQNQNRQKTLVPCTYVGKIPNLLPHNIQTDLLLNMWK